MRDSVDGVVTPENICCIITYFASDNQIKLPEKELPLVVGKSDALRRNFKMNHSRRGQRFRFEHVCHSALNGLRPGQRLGVHREQVEQAACGTLRKQLGSRAG